MAEVVLEFHEQRDLVAKLGERIGLERVRHVAEALHKVSQGDDNALDVVVPGTGVMRALRLAANYSQAPLVQELCDMMGHNPVAQMAQIIMDEQRLGRR
jgi:hypothetical protein